MGNHRAIVVGICAVLLCLGCEDISLPDSDSGTSIVGNIVITSAKDLEILEGITEVQGNIVIGPQHNRCLTIADLKSMSSLQRITGKFQLEDINQLQNLDDLVELETIGNGLSLTECISLQSIRGLKDVAITGKIELIANPLLENLNGLEKVVTLQEALIIDGNDMLSSLYGLTNLVSVGSTDDRRNVLEITDNPILGDDAAEAFASGIEVHGGILISGNSISP
ncbi:MAG: hypothetical protein GY835_00270 [bacterium]|nr:hypothetical protein [bacterium]